MYLSADELYLCCTDESHWDVSERLLLQRLVHEAIDMNEIHRYCTDTTQLGRVSILWPYISHFVAFTTVVKLYLTVKKLCWLHFPCHF